MKLKASIDIVQLENGLNQIIFDMKKVQSTSASVNSDFERMNQAAKNLATSLGLIGLATGIIELAKQAPQLSGDLVRMNLDMFKLSMTLGSALEPAFNSFATLLDHVVTFVQNHEDIFSAFGKAASDTFDTLTKIVDIGDKTLSFKLSFLADMTIGETLSKMISTFGATAVMGWFFNKAGGWLSSGLEAVGAGGAATTVTAAAGPLGIITGATSMPGEYGKEAAIWGAAGLTAGIPGGPLAMLGLGAAGTIAGLGYALSEDIQNKKSSTFSSGGMTYSGTANQRQNSTSSSGQDLFTILGIQNKYQSKQYTFLNLPGKT